MVWRVEPDDPNSAPMRFSFTFPNDGRPPITLTLRAPTGTRPLDYRFALEAITCGQRGRERIRQYSPNATRDIVLSSILSISRLAGQPGCERTLAPSGNQYVSLLCAYSSQDSHLVLDRYFREMVNRHWRPQLARLDQCSRNSVLAYRNAVIDHTNREIRIGSGKPNRILEAVRRLEQLLEGLQLGSDGQLDLAPYQAQELRALIVLQQQAAQGGGTAAAIKLRELIDRRAADPSYARAFSLAGIAR